MIGRYGVGALAAAAAVFASLATPARADAIDGDWCSSDGLRHFSIDGAKIKTPGGIQTEGDYSRHAFSYVVPEGEAAAGQPVAMVLLSEEAVRVQTGEAGEPETWMRCEVTS
jgi:hypothetical protein